MSNDTNTLCEQFIPLANKLAYQKKRVLPDFIDFEELQSAAYMGLVEAASRFDSSKGVAFSTFAYPRIWGEINDYLRQLGWGKRGENLQVASLDSTVGDDEECSLKEMIKAKEEFNENEFLEVVSQDLDEQAEEVIKCYFIDEYSMKDIGNQFGVSESRISQLIKRYKERISENYSTKQELREALAA
jgi:RNA polymerase sigma factor (sigma-70 family)